MRHTSSRSDCSSCARISVWLQLLMARSSRFNRRSASSARLCSVTSCMTPKTRRARPASSRVVSAMLRMNLTSPFGQTIRYFVS